ncbi:MAG: L,D-transpeptidase [Bradyrhizobium sp.]|nr:L,D-transpeptidase [Bradyrhizobium sp.]
MIKLLSRTPKPRTLLVVFSSLLALSLCSAASGQAIGYASSQVSVALPQNYLTNAPGPDGEDVLLERLRRSVVNFDTREAPGTIIIDTGNTALYYVLPGGRAIRYGVGVGRQGFTWSGVETIRRKKEWPDWYPPAEMIARQPYLPRFVAGGPNNPLGARAMYLGDSEYRIHGTNDQTTIGKFVSSGCIRMTNADVIDLFNRVNVGSKVVVLPKNAPLKATTKNTTPQSPRPLVAAPASGRQAMTLPASRVD